MHSQSMGASVLKDLSETYPLSQPTACIPLLVTHPLCQ